MSDIDERPRVIYGARCRDCTGFHYGDARCHRDDWVSTHIESTGHAVDQEEERQ